MSDNELIAEFMGGQRSQRGQDTVFYFTPDFRGSGFWHIDYIPFDRSWDWLMPVVEKITKMHIEKFHYDPTQIAQGNWPPDNEYMEVIALSLATPIAEAYKAIVEFIKWYNSNHPQPRPNHLIIEDMEWISVKDRLPIDKKNVLCWLGDVILMATFYPENNDNEKWAFFFSDNGRQHDDYWQSLCTHWMPLPEPPKP